MSSPFEIRNVRLFVWFRILFNARFYYPVLAILFIDFGLSAQQYALLNVAWAAAIVLLEVPSGAIADTIGRRNLLRVCGFLMFIEMGVITFVPLLDPSILFIIFIINRILSGAAEAAASGADEALAYDSLKQAGMEDKWSSVQEVLMRWQSIAFIGAMLIGGVLYDQKFMNTMIGALGLDYELSKNITMRLPLFLVFIQSLGVILVTTRMQELQSSERQQEHARVDFHPLQNIHATAMQSLKTTLSAGAWILKTPTALIIIVFGFVFDSIIRVFLTFNSQYYRVIELPEATYGVLGSVFGILGVVLPKYLKKMADDFPPRNNVFIMGALTLVGLIGLPFAIPWWGLLPLIPIMVAMYMCGFLLSNYLNRITESEQRATVLSFKGLAFNLAYGLLGVAYALLLKGLHPAVSASNPDLEGAMLEDVVFSASLAWWPPYFIVTFLITLGFAAIKLKGRGLQF